ncbi:hypothetical protein [Paenibacillus sp. DMB20]|uniref:hypothetical protein n=1 Tax=Paenibacillus sp. DMB20 TaxID=1642570 RepID=UPI000627AAFF|nr:hypothetical protein [Paenibacillus sp. DMB20]KKO51134.1 hypothetical protein XI25_29550 [Paenibacillus sp. DMB20]
MGVATDIQGLQQQLEQVRAEYHAENQRGALKDSHKVAELEAKMADISQRLDVEQRLIQHEAKIEESHNEIAYLMDTINVKGISMRELCRNEEAYQLLKEAVQLTLLERDEKWLEENKQLKEELATERQEKATQRIEINQLKVELEDAQNKRDAAVAELEDSKKEIARQNSHIDDLRRQIAVGAAGAVKTIDIGDAYERYMSKKKEEEEAKPAIYDVEQLDFKGSLFRAKLAETDEEITFGYLEKGKYREVTAQEAESFRRSAEERRHADMVQHGQNDVVEAQGELIPPKPQFQDVYSPGTEHGMDETHPGGKVEDQAVGSVEERLKALEQRVSALEGQAKGEAA